MKKHKHNFESDGGQCIICRKTMIEIFNKEDNKISKKRLIMLDDDIPSTNSKSIQEVEKEQGHGFWGNSTSGYIYDKNLKEEKRYNQR